MPRSAEGPWECKRWPVGCPLGRRLQRNWDLQSLSLSVTQRWGAAEDRNRGWQEGSQARKILVEEEGSEEGGALSRTETREVVPGARGGA